MTEDSFTYNGVDMYEQFKIRVVKYEVFMAERRQRRVTVPGRSGSYDYDAAAKQRATHNDRPLRMELVVDGFITEDRFDDLKYTFSRKGRIVLWDKPDRYFYGDLYDPAEVIEYFRHSMREIEVSFLCDPYAYANAPTTLTSSEAILPISYKGTREAPTYITIRNTGTTPMQAVRIIRREVTKGG